MKLSYKILIPIIVVTFLMLSLFGTVAYSSISREINGIYTAQIDSTLTSLEGMIQQSGELTHFVTERNDRKNLALARALAEIIRLNPDEAIKYDEMERIAGLLDVEEVHVINGNGVLVHGNEPIYYNMPFESTDQTRPFLEILKTPELEIAQELRENGHGYWFQYYGVARTDAEGFVQVGINYDVAAALQDILDIGNQVETLSVGINGFTAIIEEGAVIAHRYRDQVGKYVGEEEWFQSMMLSAGSYTWLTLSDGQQYLAGFSQVDDIVVMAAIPRGEIYAGLNHLRMVYIALVAGTAIALIAILFLCVRVFIIRPIKNISKAMDQLSRGDLNASITPDYTGEFGDLKNSINHTIGELKTYITDISNVLTNMAHDNYDVEVTGEYQGDFSPIKEGLNRIVERINTVMAGIAASAYHIAVSAQDISLASQNLAQGAVDQSSSIEFLTNALEEISERTSDAVEMLEQTGTLAQSTVSHAQQGNRQVLEMQQTIRGIVSHTDHISSVVTAIEDIATQTDLLALNASVEAVRAGQYGRGFSVVAEQVRQLANSSQAAARETASMLESTVENVGAGTDISARSLESIQVIVDAIYRIAGLVEHTSTLACEQQQNIRRVRSMINQIGDVTQGNTETSRETATTAEELHQQVDTFQQMVSHFQLRAAMRPTYQLSYHGRQQRPTEGSVSAHVTTPPEQDQKY